MSHFHQGILCDFCRQRDIAGTRYACLVCDNYDLCETCFKNKRFNSNHTAYHPIQAVSKIAPAEVFYCPYCVEKDYTGSGLIQHCRRFHAEDRYGVRCPICLVAGERHLRFLTTTLLEHLLDYHEELNSGFDGQSTTQENVECSICMENLPTDRSRVRYLQCAHGFHRRCIARWLEDNSNCPVCRTRIDLMETY